MTTSALVFAVALSVGSCDLLAASPSGRVFGWGDNKSGVITGVASSVNVTGMVTVAGQLLTNAVAISAGRDHALALRDDGTVVAWGDNRFGQVSVPGQLKDVTAIAAGAIHSVALRRNGTVVEWGGTREGWSPMPLGLSNVVAIAAGGSHTLALTRDGTVTMWGHSQIYRGLPSGLSNVVAIAAGTDESRRDLAVKSGGSVVEWSPLGGWIETGDRIPLQEDGRTVYSIKAAYCPEIEGLGAVVAVVVGGAQSLAIRGDDTVVQWEKGDNANAASHISLRPSPPATNGLVAIGGQILSNVVAVAAPASTGAFAFGRPVNHFCLALERDGTIVAWGNMDRFHPASVPSGLKHVVGIAAGPDFCLAITTDENPLK